jgi:hypothetical protein
MKVANKIASMIIVSLESVNVSSVLHQLPSAPLTSWFCKLNSRPKLRQPPQEGSLTKFQILSKAKYYERDGTIELQFYQDMRSFLVDIREHFTQIPTDVFLRLRSGYAMKMYMQVRSRIQTISATNL